MTLKETLKAYFNNFPSNHFLPLDTYMELCQQSYYRKGQPLGSLGDFITAPEISQLFGEMIGLWFLEQFHRIDTPKSFYLVELGPGKGTLMSDFLRYLPQPFKQSIKINFVEINPTLEKLQREAIYPFEALWHKSFDDFLYHASKTPLPLFLIANEFFDALPIKQFRVKDNSWHEMGLSYDKDSDQLKTLYKKSSPPALYSPKIEENLIWEYSPKSIDIVKKISSYIELYRGSSLIIDYGSNGIGHTLQAIKKHKKVDPLLFYDQADLTAHVNFSSIKTATLGKKLLTLGPTPQGLFLKNLGIFVRAEKLAKQSQNKGEKEALVSGLYRLTSFSQMGKLFQVLSIIDNYKNNKISGF